MGGARTELAIISPNKATRTTLVVGTFQYGNKRGSFGLIDGRRLTKSLGDGFANMTFEIIVADAVRLVGCRVIEWGTGETVITYATEQPTDS